MNFTTQELERIVGELPVAGRVSFGPWVSVERRASSFYVHLKGPPGSHPNFPGDLGAEATEWRLARNPRTAAQQAAKMLRAIPNDWKAK